MERWSPWGALAARDDVVFDLVEMAPEEGNGLLWPLEDGRYVIAISDALDQVERRCTLAHELVHLERRGSGTWTGQPSTWDGEVVKEEHRVNRIVATRLVPASDLAMLADALDDMGQGLTPADVAEHFGVTEELAAIALSALARERYGEAS